MRSTHAISSGPREGSERFDPADLRRIVEPINISSNQTTKIIELVQETHSDGPGIQPQDGTWSRMNHRDLACAIEVVRITLGGSRDGKTLKFEYSKLRSLFRSLRRLGFTLPLLQARIEYVDGDLLMWVLGDEVSNLSGQMLLFASFENGSEFMRHVYDAQLSPALATRLLGEYHKAAPPNYGTFDQRYALR